MPSLNPGWQQWTTAAQTATLEQRPLSTDRQSLARAAAEAQRDLQAATEVAEHAVARAHALSQQLEQALEILGRGNVPERAARKPVTDEPWSSLSPREREGLALVAEGL